MRAAASKTYQATSLQIILFSYSYLNLGSIGESSIQQLDFAFAHNPFELARGGLQSNTRADSPPALVHGRICQIISFAVLCSQYVLNLEPIKMANQLRSAPVQIAQRRIFDFVDAFDLPHHQLRV